MKTTLKYRYTRTLISFIVSCMLMLPLICADISAISINKSSITLTKGYTATLSVSDADNVTWTSSDTSVATVSKSGKVLAKGKGSCTITAKSGTQTATCEVKVLNGKLTVSQSKVNIEKDETCDLTVTAKGSHKLSIENSNRNVVKTAWLKPWDSDNIGLELTGLSSGTAKIKVYMSTYTDVYKTITVSVTDPDIPTAKTNSLVVSTNSIDVKKSSNYAFRIFSDNPEAISVTSSDSSIADVGVPAWDGYYATCVITGKKSGKVSITVASADNKALNQPIDVNVVSDGYYEITDTKPRRNKDNDHIHSFESNGKTKYMLCTYDYDMAYINTLIAKYEGKYKYYTVYDMLPIKQTGTDQTTSFRTAINGKSVTRYVLLPKDYDKIGYNTLTASYNKLFGYWVIYDSKPSKQTETDIIMSWTVKNGGAVKSHYVLLPYDYSAERFETLKSGDTADRTAYYVIYDYIPELKTETDSIYTIRSSTGIHYMLLPKDPDIVRRDTVKAKFTGNYFYWTIYETSPEKMASTDTVKSWNKIINNTVVKRYMLLPDGYSEEMLEYVINDDVSSGSSAADNTVI